MGDYIVFLVFFILREYFLDDDYNYFIEKMVEGNIVIKDEIF